MDTISIKAGREIEVEPSYLVSWGRRTKNHCRVASTTGVPHPSVQRLKLRSSVSGCLPWKDHRVGLS